MLILYSMQIVINSIITRMMNSVHQKPSLTFASSLNDVVCIRLHIVTVDDSSPYKVSNCYIIIFL